MIVPVLLLLLSPVLSAMNNFLIYTSQEQGSTPLSLLYDEQDLSSSGTMSSLCSDFVRENAEALNVASGTEQEKAMAANICTALAEQNGVEYIPSSEFLPAEESNQIGGDVEHNIVRVDKVLSFMKNGWTVLPNIVPELNDEVILRNINDTHKRRKFEYLTDAFYMAKKKWNIDPEDTREHCPVDFQVGYLNEHNLADDDLAETAYRLGLSFLICTMNYHINNSPAGHSMYVPFNQVINIHRINDAINNIATSRRMGQIAAELLRHDNVRLYQTALFSKDNVGLNLQTMWHRDLNMIPLDTKSVGSLTFWCPLYRRMEQRQGDSMLRFLSGSHRDISHKIWYHVLDDMENRYGGYSQARYLNVGDCTAHHGWLIHCATKQPDSAVHKDRLAIGFTYIAGDSTVLPDLYCQNRSQSHRRTQFGDEDEYSYREWIKDLKEGDVIDHPLLPLVFDSRQ